MREENELDNIDVYLVAEDFFAIKKSLSCKGLAIFLNFKIWNFASNYFNASHNQDKVDQ